jgi:hypothetical protein
LNYIYNINNYLVPIECNYIGKNNLFYLANSPINLESIFNIINEKPIILLYIINVLGYCYFFYFCYTDYYITKRYFNGRRKKPLKVFLRIHLFCYLKQNLLNKVLIIPFIIFTTLNLVLFCTQNYTKTGFV